MSAHAQRGAGLAAGRLAKAKALGETISFSHVGGSANTLYIEILRPAHTVELLKDGVVAGVAQGMEFLIPVQTNFAYPSGDTEPIRPGDKCSYRSRDHFVVECAASEDYGYTYRVKAVERKMHSLGANP